MYIKNNYKIKIYIQNLLYDLYTIYNHYLYYIIRLKLLHWYKKIYRDFAFK